MGQVQSEEPESGEKSSSQDASELELNCSCVEPAQAATSGARKKPQEVFSGMTQSPAHKLAREQHHVRKLSNVSQRNIQLLSIKPRSEMDAYADDLRTRRRSSLINLILGAPSSGPRFSDDLCSLSSHITECNFGIEFFPDAHHCSNTSLSSLVLDESVEDVEKGAKFNCKSYNGSNQKRRRSSLGSLGLQIALATASASNNPNGRAPPVSESRKLQLASTLASIDLSGSFDDHCNKGLKTHARRPPLCKSKQTIFESLSQDSWPQPPRQTSQARGLRRSGSEVSLYSAASAGSAILAAQHAAKKSPRNPLRETKSIIILQVCLPFILAGFGNMLAGLILSRLAHWRSFQQVPTFFILLPSFVGLKGNIEMTFASRLSTLSNLNLLDTNYQRRRIYVSNLALILSQAVALSTFAALVSVACELIMGPSKFHDQPSQLFRLSILVVLASALATAVVLVILSSIVVSLSVALANLIKVNPDNLSTLVAALYGDASCVLIYGLFADLMFKLNEQNSAQLPGAILSSSIIAWPLLLFVAYRLKETRGIAFSSLPPMLAAILVSMGSGAVLAHFVERFKLIALYQPVVNGFGANLIAVQASRVSTWLWCSELRRLSSGQGKCEVKKKKNLGSLASFSEPVQVDQSKEEKKKSSKESTLELVEYCIKLIKKLFWSFLNSSPNAVAARLLLLMLIPAHTIYFFSIWLLSPDGYIEITWQFYLVYVVLCITQVFILLTLCEPLMSLFMKLNLDPDIFGISLLMALADLTGTLCLAGAFVFLAGIGDANAV